MRSMPIFAFAVAAVALVGCSNEDATDSGSSDITVSQATLSAQVSEARDVESQDKCNVDMTRLTVKVTNDEATRKINNALTYDLRQRLLSEECATRSLNIVTRYSVKYNAKGVLSVAAIEDYNPEGAAHPSRTLWTWNFDLVTGDFIELGDLLTDAGEGVVVANCQATMFNAGQSADKECEDSVKVLQFRGRPVYSIEDQGLRIYPVDLPYAIWSLAEAGALTPWAGLKGEIAYAPFKGLTP